MTVKDLADALHAARLRNFSFQTIIFEPARMKMHVSLNRTPASAGPYGVFDLGELFGG